jgi:hypothetical protein
MLTLGVVLVISTQLIATDSKDEQLCNESFKSSTPKEVPDYFIENQDQFVKRCGFQDPALIRKGYFHNTRFEIPETNLEVTSKFLACSEDTKKAILLHFIQQNPDMTDITLCSKHFENFQEILTIISKQQLNSLTYLHILGDVTKMEKKPLTDDMIAPIGEFKNLKDIVIYFAVLSKCPPIQGLTELLRLEFDSVTFNEQNKVFKEIEDLTRTKLDLKVRIRLGSTRIKYTKGISKTKEEFYTYDPATNEVLKKVFYKQNPAMQ